MSDAGTSASRPSVPTQGRIAALLGNPPVWAVLAACALVLSLRRAGAVTNPQFWAEDSYFFENAYEYGWRAFTIPFAGYLHTILRAIAELSVLIDPAHARWTFLACSSAVTLYVSSRALSRRCPLPRAWGACALAVVMVPDTYEVLLTVVNLQWVLAAGFVLLLVSRDPEGPLEGTHDVLAALALGLTGPFSLVLSPLFLVRAATRRSRASTLLACIVVATAIVQGTILAGQPAIGAWKPGNHAALQLVLPAIGRRLGGSLLMGSLLSPDTDLYVGSVVGAATLAAAGFLAFRAGRERGERVLLGLAFFGLLAGSFYRLRYDLPVFFAPGGGARYFYVPQLLFAWLLAAAAGEQGLTGRIAPVLLGWAVLVNLPRYREPAYLDSHWSRFEDSIRQGRPVVVPVNPAGWVMPLPARPPSR